VGSSLFKEIEGDQVDGESIIVHKTTLSAELEKFEQLKYLIKLDLQGAELLALTGCPAKVFSRESIFIIESNLYANMIGSENQFSNLIKFMGNHSFTLYDICGMNYRPLDQALAQVDLVFVHQESILRQDHAYATQNWRQQQFNKAKTKYVEKINA